MKIAFTILPFLLLLLFSTSKAQNGKEMRYDFKASKFNKEKVNGETYWLVECVLSNNSKDTLNYLSMSCSWTDFYSADLKHLEIEAFLCDKNFPVIVSIPPGKTMKVVLRFFKSKKIKQLSSKFFKVGLNLIETKSTMNFENKINSRNIIWSNSVELW